MPKFANKLPKMSHKTLQKLQENTLFYQNSTQFSLLFTNIFTQPLVERLYLIPGLICSIGVFNRPGVARAVLQTPSSFIHSLSQSVSDPLWKYIQNTFTPKPKKLGS